jgi:hypothetical protein
VLNKSSVQLKNPIFISTPLLGHDNIMTINKTLACFTYWIKKHIIWHVVTVKKMGGLLRQKKGHAECPSTCVPDMMDEAKHY